LRTINTDISKLILLWASDIEWLDWKSLAMCLLHSRIVAISDSLYLGDRIMENFDNAEK